SCAARDSSTCRSGADERGARGRRPGGGPQDPTTRESWETDAPTGHRQRTSNEVEVTSAAHFSAWRDRVAQSDVLIVGDAMLDRYWFGDVERISPEAPVPVVKIARAEERPGGAANVARNVAALGARAMLISATGRDEPADTL